MDDGEMFNILDAFLHFRNPCSLLLSNDSLRELSPACRICYPWSRLSLPTDGKIIYSFFFRVNHITNRFYTIT